MPNKRTQPQVKFAMMNAEDLSKSEAVADLAKNLSHWTEKQNKVQRIAFEVDPSTNNQYYSVYIPKQNLLPDAALKQISMKDSLISAIIVGRSNQAKAFGHPAKDRFSDGFKIEIKPQVEMALSQEEKEALQKRIAHVTAKLYNCGETKGFKDTEYMTLSDYLFRSARDALIVGRTATEILYNTDPYSGKKKFHSFRPVDAGSVYKAAYLDKKAAQSIREAGLKLIKQLTNTTIDADKFKNEEYSWFQVINGKPEAAFTSEELLVHNFYPTNHMELYDYPLTPIDTIISEVITHINIVNHNKLYFQSGRASRGMVVIKSEDVDDGVIEQIRQQFNASINSVANAWRMPVFGVGQNDEIDWKPIDSGARDMEFQFLSDNNARVIMAGFQVSPDEIPGYGHLSKATANQALSESNNEFKLEAARDVGIRPFIMHFQDFLNSRILPLFDIEIAEKCYLSLVGLDSDSPEKEATRLLQDSTIHMSMNQILTKVEKDPIPRAMGGDFPFNSQYQQYIPLYKTFGQILEFWFDEKGAAEKEENKFYQNPFWMQYQQLLDGRKQNEHQMQMQQAQMQMQSQQQDHQQTMDKQQAQQPQGGAEGQPQQGQAPAPGQSQVDPNSVKVPDVTTGVNQLLEMLGKSEAQLTPDKQKLYIHQKLTIKKVMDSWNEESKKVLGSIVMAVKNDIPDKEE